MRAGLVLASALLLFAATVSCKDRPCEPCPERKTAGGSDLGERDPGSEGPETARDASTLGQERSSGVSPSAVRCDGFRQPDYMSRDAEPREFSLSALFPGKTEYREKIRVDLDGDRIEEELSLGAFEPESLTILLDQKEAATITGDALTEGFAVVDLDPKDSFREVVVYDNGPSDDPLYTFLRLQGGSLVKVATIPGDVSYSRSGVLYVNERAGGDVPWSWSVRKKYVWKSNKDTYRPVAQELYWIGEKALVNETFPIMDRRGGSPIARPAPSTEIAIVACELGQTPNSWCLVKTTTDLLGWVQLEVLADEVTGDAAWYAD